MAGPVDHILAGYRNRSNAEAEACLLGCLILKPSILPDLRDVVPSSAVFTSEKHSAIFDAIVRCYSVHPDHAADISLVSMGATAFTAAEAVDIATSIPAPTNWPYYAKIVRGCWIARRALDISGKIAQFANNGMAPAEMVSAIESEVFALARESEPRRPETTEQAMDRILDDLEHGEDKGIRTGFIELDRLTQGFRPGEMIVIGARPSIGKSALMMNIALHMASKGVHVGVFSLEMSRDALIHRMIAGMAGVDSQRMRRKNLTPNEWEGVLASCESLKGMPIVLNDAPDSSVSYVRSEIRRMVRKHGTACIFIDYLQLMTTGRRENRNIEVGDITKALKAAAGEAGVPVVVLCQLNRESASRHDFRPRLADLRDSGSIEQDADTVLLLHREEQHHPGDQAWRNANPELLGLAELIVAKQRGGPTGVVYLEWEEKQVRFFDTNRRQDYAPQSGAGHRPDP